MEFYQFWTKKTGHGYGRSFSLFTIWYNPYYWGITILNTGIAFKIHEENEIPDEARY